MLKRILNLTRGYCPILKNCFFYKIEFRFLAFKYGIMLSQMDSMNTIIYTPLFLENSDELFRIILNNTKWYTIHYFKRHVSHYRYNFPELNNIFIDIEKQFSRKFTGAFLNCYKDGS